MANYTNYDVTLTEGQIRKIKSSYDNGSAVTIRISKKDLSGNIKIPLTQTQINKIKNLHLELTCV